MKHPVACIPLVIALLGLGAVAFAEDPQGQAMLVGSPGSPARDLFAIEFTAVDGRNIPARDVLWVDSGTRLITVRVPARFTEPQVQQQRQKWDDYVDIELELEAGKVYELRGRYNRTDRVRPYDIVIDSVRKTTDD
jgi:hypothetical protein